MEVKVSWKLDGLYHADPQKVCKEITSIGDEATPAQIVEKAKNKNTELHKCFEWDNDVAAEKWRLQQARMVCTNLVITKVDNSGNEEPTPVRVFYKTDNSQNTGYKQTSFIVEHIDEYEKLVNKCERELKSLRTKYEKISEYNEIWELIDSL